MAGRPQQSPLAMMLLAMLAEAPMHAYQLQQLIKQRGKDTVVNVARSNSVYQVIDRLLASGSIGVREVARDEGRPERTVYEITAEGRASFERWLDDTLAVPAREFPAFPVVLSLLPMTTPENAAAQLQRRADRLADELDAPSDTGSLPRVVLIDDEYRAAMAHAELAWLRALIADLTEGRFQWSQDELRALADRTRP